MTGTKTKKKYRFHNFGKTERIPHKNSCYLIRGNMTGETDDEELVEKMKGIRYRIDVQEIKEQKPETTSTTKKAGRPKGSMKKKPVKSVSKKVVKKKMTAKKKTGRKIKTRTKSKT